MSPLASPTWLPILLVCILVGGCASNATESAIQSRIDVTTAYAGTRESDVEPEVQLGAPATGGELRVLLLDAMVHPTSGTAGNANGTSDGALQSERRGGNPSGDRRVSEGTTLALGNGETEAGFILSLNESGMATVHLAAGREYRLRLEVIGEVPGARAGCVFVQAEGPVSLDTLAATLAVTVPYDIECGIAEP